MRYFHPAYWLLFVLALSIPYGCSQFVQPTSFRQQVAYVEGGLTAAYQTIGQLKVSGRITAEGRNKLVEQADVVGSALDATYAALAAGNEGQAANSLQIARTALIALQKALEGLQ